MKKIKLIIISLLATGFAYSQTIDTICHMIAGKINFEFDYYESEIINKDTSIFLENKEILINENEFLVLDLYDNCECVKSPKFIKEREVIIYSRNEKVEHNKYPSGDTTLYFNGSEIKKIIIKKPKLKKENLHNIKKNN